MLSWQLFEFFGIVPRLRRKQLPRNHATVAHDVDLTHGTLKAFREPLKISDKTARTKGFNHDKNVTYFSELFKNLT